MPEQILRHQKYLYIYGVDNLLRIWNIETEGVKLLSHHQDTIVDAKVRDNRLITMDAKGIRCIWSLGGERIF